MADNYLERAMEDLAAGKYKKAGKYKSSAPGPRTHLYIREINENNTGQVRELVREGYKISFSFPAGHVGTKLARTLRCHYRPLSLGVPPDAKLLNSTDVGILSK